MHRGIRILRNSMLIFSGLLKCSLCGANVTIVSGCSRKRTDVRYGCSLHYNRGRSACGNKLLVPRRALESQLLAGLQAKVPHPDVVSYALKCFEAQLAQAFDRRREESATHRRRESEIERKIESLTRALADGYPSQGSEGHPLHRGRGGIGRTQRQAVEFQASRWSKRKGVKLLAVCSGNRGGRLPRTV